MGDSVHNAFFDGLDTLEDNFNDSFKKIIEAVRLDKAAISPAIQWIWQLLQQNPDPEYDQKITRAVLQAIQPAVEEANVKLFTAYISACTKIIPQSTWKLILRDWKDSINAMEETDRTSIMVEFGSNGNYDGLTAFIAAGELLGSATDALLAFLREPSLPFQFAAAGGSDLNADAPPFVPPVEEFGDEFVQGMDPDEIQKLDEQVRASIAQDDEEDWDEEDDASCMPPAGEEPVRDPKFVPRFEAAEFKPSAQQEHYKAQQELYRAQQEAEVREELEEMGLPEEEILLAIKNL